MKILLDECLPRRLKDQFASHECYTVPEALLGGKKNGELLAIAEREGFEIFLTMDKGSNTSRISVAVRSPSSFFAPNQLA